MCLYVTGDYTNPSKSDRDIECFKILLETNSGFCYTPYTLKRVRPVELSGEKTFDAIGPIEMDYGHGVLRIGFGFIHAYDDEILARQMSESIRILLGKQKGTVIIEGKKLCVHPVIYRCIIPEGVDIYRNGKGEIAGKRIRFIEKLKRFE